MKNYFQLVLFLLIPFLVSNKVFSQTNTSSWQIGANTGFAVYQGDLTPHRSGSYKLLKPSIGFNISRIFTPDFKLRTSIALGQLKGDEGLYVKPPYRKERNLSFTTSFAEISEILIWNFLGQSSDINYKRFSPYIFGGVGVSLLNINRSSSKTTAAYLLNEPIAAAGLLQDLQTAPPKAIMVFPAGLGLEIFISPSVSLNGEINFRYTRTDYLDGFSKIANPKVNDYFYTNTIGIIYKLGKKNLLDCPVLKL